MTSGGSGSKGHDFLRTIAQFAEANAKPSSANKPVKLGRVDYSYNPADFLGGVNPRILFDGENTVSQKRYQVLAGYYPLPGARVCLIPVGTTYLIIGSVESTPQDPKVEIFTESGAWEKSPGARMVRVQCQGGGGGGGGCPAPSAGQAAAAGGGGGGGYAESWITANAAGSSETVTVGSGGSGGTAADDGDAGGSSSFGSLVSASGGGGGTQGAAVSTRQAIAGGTGGTAPTGDLQIQGGDGFNGYTHNGEITYSGSGGESHLAGNRRGTAVSGSASNGTSGYTYGGGGGGGVTRNSGTSNGGSGASGIVIVTTYF